MLLYFRWLMVVKSTNTIMSDFIHDTTLSDHRMHATRSIGFFIVPILVAGHGKRVRWLELSIALFNSLLEICDSLLRKSDEVDILHVHSTIGGNSSQARC